MMYQIGIFLIFGATISGIATLGCNRQGYFDRHKGSRLLDSVIKKIAVPTLPDCIYKCIEENLLCLSINYQHGNGDIKQCYLNNRTRRTAPAENFKSDPGFTYYEKDPCVPNPCLFGGTCSKENIKKEFLCSCMPMFKGSFCEIEPLGWSSRRPGKSCKDIKSSGDGLYDGKYWMDPENSGKTMQVYCDMRHEGGGWLLVSNIIVSNPASISSFSSLTLQTSYRDIANYDANKTIISTTALGQLRQHINFTQFRFQCRVAIAGRTVHLITAANSKGYDVVDYFTTASNTQPHACESFYRGAGDNSILAAQCAKWDLSSGKWSGQAYILNEWRLNDHPFYLHLINHWVTTGNRMECDNRFNEALNPGDYWKIYVR